MGLGLSSTRHGERAEGEVGRKGMSVERTFAAISEPSDVHAKVRTGTAQVHSKGQKPTARSACLAAAGCAVRRQCSATYVLGTGRELPRSKLTDLCAAGGAGHQAVQQPAGEAAEGAHADPEAQGDKL